jgi:hypothetical protein
MRIALRLAFWVGLFNTVREWRFSKKHGVPITLGERVPLILALPLGLAAQLAFEEAGFRPGDGVLVMLVTGAVLNGWPIGRRIQRKTA